MQNQLAIQRDIVLHQHDIISRKDDRIATLTTANKSLSQQNRRWAAYAQRLEQQLSDANATDPLALERIGSRRRKAQWLTPQGSLALALRRNMSNVSTADFGFVILDDVSKWTVSRCEVKCGTALIASARLWFQKLKHDIFSVRPSEYSTSIVATRQDATHGKNKVAALELSAAYLAGFASSDDNLPDWESYHRIKRVGDVLRIKDETAEGTLGFTKKVLAGLGAPSWDSWSSMPYADANQFFVRTCNLSALE